MSLGGLNSALSGLRIAQQQLDVIANNVSNVGTAGYSRKILPQVTLAAEGQAYGVKGMAVSRYVDMDLSRDLWTQTSATDLFTVQSKYLNRIQEFHGAPEKQMSISAELARLRDSFTALSDSPEEANLQYAALENAKSLVSKINGLADLVTTMRNDTQSDMNNYIEEANSLLRTIAEANSQIKYNTAVNKTTAALEDTRDSAIKALSSIMEVSFFRRGDNVLVVQTKEGVQLADEKAETIHFSGTPLGATMAYPNDTGGIYIGGNPQTHPNAIEITQRNIGGKLGALIELRDQILPQQQAQLDELSHKLAMRFDAQGLRLFTDSQGNIPLNTDPNITSTGTTPVPYVGFSSIIQVNPDILNDSSLIQKGTATTDVPVLNGSNEVIRRVIQFAMGDVEYQESVGTIDLRAAATGTTTLQEWLGLSSTNLVKSSVNLSTFADLNALMTSGGVDNFVPPPPAAPLNAQFSLTFEEPRTGLGPTTITIDLGTAQANHPITPGGPQNAADQLRLEIADLIAASGLPAGLTADVQTNQYGQLSFTSNGNITVSNQFVGGMTNEALNLLGLHNGTTVSQDPYIDIQIGAGAVHRVTIEPGDTEVELMAKLNYDSATGKGIPGLHASLDATTGALTLRPGNVDATGRNLFGGDIKIVGGPFTTNGTGGATIPNASSVIYALFGSNTPVSDVRHPNFRNSAMGVGASLTTGIISSSNLLEFGQKLVNRQTEEFNRVSRSMEDSDTFRALLENRQNNESSVNLEEELSNLIVMQTAYTAAAKVVSTIDEQFRELLNAF
jgi:flagellar hook-associated protein 1 FlgK